MNPIPPNVETERRHDHGARKIIDSIQKMNVHLIEQDGELVEIKSALKHTVSYQWLIVVAFTFASAVIGAAWMLVSDTRSAVESNRHERQLEILQVRSDMTKATERLESKVDALYRFTIERQPREVVKAAVQEAEKRDPPLLTPLPNLQQVTPKPR